jgi:hypothetical protein
VCLGGEVDDRVHGADLVDVFADGDVSAVAVHVLGQVRRVAGVGELVEDNHVFARGEHPLDEVRADESRTPCH